MLNNHSSIHTVPLWYTGRLGGTSISERAAPEPTVKSQDYPSFFLFSTI